MAAISNPTNSTAVTELIESEIIQGQLIADAHRPTAVFEALADLLDVSSQPTATVSLPQWTSDSIGLSAGSGKTETDEFAYVEQDTVEDTITVSTVGIRKGLSLEAISDTVLDLVAGTMSNSMLDMLNQMDVDQLSVITDATTTADHSGVDLTRAHIVEALADMAGNNPHAGALAGVFHSRQIADLRNSLNSAGDAFVVSQGASDLFQYGRQGYVGRWMGIDFYESNNVPQYDSNNWSGAILRPGQMGAMVMAVKQPRTIAFKDFPERNLLDVIVLARYGVTLRLPANLVEIVSSKT